MKFHLIVAVGLLLVNIPCFSQSEKENDEGNKPGINQSSRDKFFTGLYLGSYFANKYTAKFYDGYGYDINGNKNDFFHSFMYRRIVIDYGSTTNGQSDHIAQELNVNPGEWTFDEKDMPVKMKYNPAVIIGLQMCYPLTSKDVLLLNLNTSKLSASGIFTIVKNISQIGPQQPNRDAIQAFSITGAEQRFWLQLGYRRIVGQGDLLNFFIEGGASINTTKYLKNQAMVNNLVIDLSSYYTDPYYTTYKAYYLKGTGLGVFAGFGVNLEANTKWSMQLLYSPSYERINIGANSKFTFHHTIGIRIFYKFS